MSEAEQILAPQKAEVTTTEVPKTEAPVQDQKLAQKLEVLMRREAQALGRERAAKQKELEVQSFLKTKEEFESVKSNPKKALELLGMDVETLIKALGGEGIGPEVEMKALKNEIEQLKQSTKADKDQKVQEEKRRAEAELTERTNGFKGEIKSYIDQNKEKFELINFDQAESLVYDVIETNYNRTMDDATGMGKIMEISEAAEKVEKFLEDKYKKVSEVKKLQSLLSQATKPAHEEIIKQAKQMNQTQQRPKTLTNALSATPQKPRTKPLTDEERVQKAIAYARQLRSGSQASI